MSALLTAETVQASAFKTIFDVMKDMVTDVNIMWDAEGMKLITADNAKVVLIHLVLPSDNWETYDLQSDLITGVNVSNMTKILKTVGSNDTLRIEVLTDDSMSLQIMNSDKGHKTRFDLKLMDLPDEGIEGVEGFEPLAITVLPSQDFQRMCRDMKDIAEEITITRLPNAVRFTCDGDFVLQDTHVDIEDELDQEIADGATGRYSLKYLGSIIKATPLSQMVEMAQDSEETPIVLTYAASNLGTLKFYLAPRLDDD